MPLSGDDYFYDSNVIEQIVNVFLKKDCNVLVTSRCLVKSDNNFIISPTDKEIKKITSMNNHIQQNKAFITSNFYNMASGSALYFKKSFLKEWGYFDESYYLWEDGPFLTKYTLNNKLEYDYSIISIKYNYGGVSNNGINPLMKADILHYNNTDRINSIKLHDFWVKRKVKYIVDRDNARNKYIKIFVYIKYIDISILKILKILKRLLKK